jgi:hypothetical protein
MFKGSQQIESLDEIEDIGRGLGFASSRLGKDKIGLVMGEVGLVVKGPGPFECTTRLPFNGGLLPLFGGEESTSCVCTSDKIQLKDRLDTRADAGKVLLRGKNCSALTGDATVSEEIAKVLVFPHSPTLGRDFLEQASLDNLSRAMAVCQAVIVRASMHSVLVHLGELGGEPPLCVREAYLSQSGTRMQVLEFLEKFPSYLLGRDILVNGDVLRQDETALAAYLGFCERINLAGDPLAARILIVLGADLSGAYPAVPVAMLPDVVGAAVKGAMEEAGVADSPANQACAAALAVSGGDPAQACRLVSDFNAVRAEDDKKTGLRPDALGAEHYRRPPDLVRLRRTEAMLREVLAERFVGQAPAVAAAVAALLGWLGRPGPRLPLALAFCGPAGCGKNHLAEIIARATAHFFRLAGPHYLSYQASNYVSESSRWSLTGVQYGLVGAKTPALLDALGRGSVFTLDEIDKSPRTTELQAFSMDIIESGSFRNGIGSLRQVRDTVFILTMNAGVEETAEIRTIGFKKPGAGRYDLSAYRSFYDKNMLPALRRRINAACFFELFSEGELETIARRELARAADALAAAGMAWAGDLDAQASEIAATADPLLGATGVANAVRARYDRLFSQGLSAAR